MPLGMSRWLKISFLAFLVLLFLVFFISNITIADNPTQGPYSPPEPGPGGATGNSRGGTSIPLENPLGTNSIIGIINKILSYLIYISVPFLALMILVGGFQILFARDSAEKVQSGRKTIQWAVIGFAIILVSKGVALILLQVLGG